MKKVLAVLTINPDFVEFAIPQLKSILQATKLPFQTLFHDQFKQQNIQNLYEITHDKFKYFPFVTINVPNFINYRKFFQEACKKSVMVSKFVLLIAEGHSYEELIKNRDEQILKQQCRNEEEILMCDFISRNRVVNRQQQLRRITQILGGNDIRGKVNIKKANKIYSIFEDHEWYQGHHKSELHETLKKLYFGIELCNNKIGTLKFNNQYELSKRIYLGPTSADNDLAFLMCNQSLIQEGSLVYDPFVGTGGLLIPPASMGAITFGSDLDIRVLNGYSVGRINKRSPFYKEEKKYELYTPKINLNFEQYGFLTPNIIRIDSTTINFRAKEIFDAIITDPPYGIRAMSRSVTKKQNKIETHQEKIEIKLEIKQETQILQRQEILIDKRQTFKNESESESEKSSNSQGKKKQLTEEQKLKKIERRRLQKQNRRKRKALVPQQQKQFKKSIVNKLNRQRIDQWDKFDRNKIETTEREIIFEGLLTFASKYLRVGGRLVFLFPIFEEETYTGIKNLPPHHGYDVIDLSQNKMARGNSRILVTLQKQ